MEVIKQTKTAICREKIKPKDSVTQKVMASDLVERDTMLICRPLIREKPIKSTRVAREASGINSTVFPRRKKPKRTSNPVYILEFRVDAPDCMLRDDLVREPDAGIQVKREQPRLVRPMERVSLLVSMRSPTLEANDFPMESPSSKQSSDRATDTQRISCQ